jgi:hypothetical protein
VAFWYLRFAISPRSAIGAEARHLPKAITRKTAAITRIAAAIFSGAEYRGFLHPGCAAATASGASIAKPRQLAALRRQSNIRTEVTMVPL